MKTFYDSAKTKEDVESYTEQAMIDGAFFEDPLDPRFELGEKLFKITIQVEEVISDALSSENPT